MSRLNYQFFVNLDEIKIQIGGLMMSGLIWIFTVCNGMSEFTAVQK